MKYKHTHNPQISIVHSNQFKPTITKNKTVTLYLQTQKRHPNCSKLYCNIKKKGLKHTFTKTVSIYTKSPTHFLHQHKKTTIFSQPPPKSLFFSPPKHQIGHSLNHNRHLNQDPAGCHPSLFRVGPLANDMENKMRTWTKN